MNLATRYIWGDKATLYTKLTGWIKVEEGFVNYSEKRGCWEFTVPDEHGYNKNYLLYKVVKISTATMGQFTTT